jgi:phosphatidylethanolamine/phosphatidyl-N-methylethanolamine N-methyltransferase
MTNAYKTEISKNSINSPWIWVSRWIDAHKSSRALWKIIKTCGKFLSAHTQNTWNKLTCKSKYIRYIDSNFKKIFIKHEDSLSFIGAFFLNPRAMGAIMPSSKYLAREMAAHIIHKDKLIVELGAGTGIVTEALLREGIHPENIIIIEYSSDFVKKLQERFPAIRVIEGNAAHLISLLNDKRYNVNTIISSIPMLSLPQDITTVILDQIERVLPKGGRYIQFTYDIFQRKKISLTYSKKVFSKCIWSNLPPARVNVWEK